MEPLLYTIFAFLLVVLFLAVPVALLVLLIISFARSQRIGGLEKRLAQLENQLRQGPAPIAAPLPDRQVATEISPVVEAEIVVEGASPFQPGAEVIAAASIGPADQIGTAPQLRPSTSPRGWELVLGRSVLGWVAVVALVLATATFLKYAFENSWIGPQGQLSLILAGGLFVVGLAYYYATKGWRLFAQILLSAGLAVIYLATYASFGFYHVVSQEVGLVFLIVIVVEAALLALVYEAWAVALVALLGGLATPLLISSPHDQYLTLFAYLAVLNGGTLFILWRRPWPALGTIALVGAQGLFLYWYHDFYHPEKLAWALGFQGLLWGMYLAYHMLEFVWGSRKAGPEDLIRLLLGASLGFSQLVNLLTPEYAPWLGTVAVVLAIVYAGLAHAAFHARPNEEAGLLTLVTAVLGLVGVAIPLEARADWVALGWAIMGGALWTFGIRVERVALRGMGVVALVMAIGRLLLVDTLRGPSEPFWPIFNEFALPALGVVACLLGSVMLTWNRARRLVQGEREAAIFAGVAGAVLLGWVISWDLIRWFDLQARFQNEPTWRWMGQVAVSAWWAVYASLLLAIGFKFHRPIARWLALGLFGLTALKVFFIDLASVGELQRILALFILAILLGSAAWAYQRVRPASQRS